mmetsp:Transcript_157242/g.501367  ORF Transcript_157242/g.501367 Transcript_157242/m.501367 type:complete len:223 (-) Transcript_157242:298-966(-)
MGCRRFQHQPDDWSFDGSLPLPEPCSGERHRLAVGLAGNERCLPPAGLDCLGHGCIALQPRMVGEHHTWVLRLSFLLQGPGRYVGLEFVRLGRLGPYRLARILLDHRTLCDLHHFLGSCRPLLLAHPGLVVPEDRQGDGWQAKGGSSGRCSPSVIPIGDCSWGTSRMHRDRGGRLGQRQETEQDVMMGPCDLSVRCPLHVHSSAAHVDVFCAVCLAQPRPQC